MVAEFVLSECVGQRWATLYGRTTPDFGKSAVLAFLGSSPNLGSSGSRELGNLCRNRRDCVTKPVFVTFSGRIISKPLRPQRIIIIALLCLLAGLARGASELPVVIVDAEFRVQLLNGQIGILAADSSFSLEQVEQKPDSFYEVSGSTNFLFGLTKNKHWLKYRLYNEGVQSRELLLEIVNPNLTDIVHHQFIGNRLMRSDSAGSEWPFSHRPLRHQNFLFPISLSPGDTITGYLELAPMPQPMNFNLFFWDQEERLGRQINRETIWLAGFFQLNLIFLVLVMVVAAVFRERALWYYSAYVAFGAILVAVDLGLGYRYLWPHSPYWQRTAGFLFTNAYLICGIQFVRHYFNTALRYRRFDRVFLGAIAVTAVFLVLSFVFPYVPLRFAHFLSRAHYSLYLLGSIMFLLLFVRDLTVRRHYAAAWFLLAFSLHSLGILGTLLQTFGLIPGYSAAEWLLALNWPVTFYTQLTLMIGMVLEIPIVIFIAYKTFNTLVRDNTRQLRKLAQLREKNMQSLVVGMETERRRLAQDLHDGLSVNLAAIKMKANLMEMQAPETERSRWQEIMRDVEGVYGELRHIVHNLPPRSLFKMGLQQALEEVIKRTRLLQPQLQLHYQYHLPATRPLPEAEAHIFRMVLELMNNALKHAEASELTIQLTAYDQQQVLLTVEDNGNGFRPGRRKDKGMGLTNIQQRVNLLNGKLHVDSHPGQGTTVIAELPYRAVFG